MKIIKGGNTMDENNRFLAGRDIPALEEKIGEHMVRKYYDDNISDYKSLVDARDYLCRDFLEYYGAGNFVRAAESKFKKVHYFTCSALGHNHEGKPYAGKNVVEPLLWLLEETDSSVTYQ